jgi:hypothetical protein
MDKIESMPQGSYCYTTKSMDETNSVVKNNIHGCVISAHTEYKDDLGGIL